MFFLHLVASLILFVCMTRWVDGFDFQTGSATSIFQIETRLYQTQVNGLLSLALVLVRLLASSCTALVVWRMIYVLLEKEALTLTELTRLNNYKVPILPRLKSKSRMLWFSWVTMIVVFLWPSSFSAPLANSSLAWNLSQSLGPPSPISFAAWGKSDFWFLRAIEWRMKSVMNAVVMTGSDPEYAFGQTDLPLRRYFHPSIMMSDNSTVSTTLPYFDVQLRWIDAGSDDHSSNIDNSSFTDFVNPGSSVPSRLPGSVIVVRNESWHPMMDAPSDAAILVAQRLIAVHVSTYNNETLLKNGSFATEYIPCRKRTLALGDPPEFPQHKVYFFHNGGF